MANTSYRDIYARYMIRIKDYDAVQRDDELMDQYMHDLLMLAIDDFADMCVQDITDYDDELEEFNVQLTRREQSILSLCMVKHWVEPFVYNSDALQNAMSTKDFSIYSPANLLMRMTDLLKQTERQLLIEKNLYSFRTGDVAGLTE